MAELFCFRCQWICVVPAVDCQMVKRLDTLRTRVNMIHLLLQEALNKREQKR
jgi:hypothetical protein